jgi:hypothetical protein
MGSKPASLLTKRTRSPAHSEPSNHLQSDSISSSLAYIPAFPTEDEKIAFLPEMKTSEATETFARAILTSNRFLFVQ